MMKKGTKNILFSLNNHQHASRTALIYLAFLFVIYLLAGCGTSNLAPVDHRSQPPSKKITTHEVAKGETLFSIAWAYGLDYRGLARANGIDRSFTIHPGQLLNLTDQGYESSTSRVTTGSRPVTTTPSVHGGHPVTASKPVVKQQSVLSNIPDSALKWYWPANGVVLGRFSGNGNKGIDIGGKLGDPVRASASGNVVYSGSGLLGYGQLVIVKHNDQFLSAYAHNRVLLVKEGDSVKAGDKIAEIGSSGAEKVKLHFEIRRDGKPVDPERYLPRR